MFFLDHLYQPQISQIAQILFLVIRVFRVSSRFQSAELTGTTKSHETTRKAIGVICAICG